MKKTNIKHLTFLGSGNVASHLAQAFTAAGCVVDQIYSPHLENARRLADGVKAEPIDSFSQISSSADAYIVAITDDALAHLADELHLPDRLVVHTSGTTPMSVLTGVSSRCAVMWPPQTFAREVPMDYSQLHFCIEASSDEVAMQVEALARMVTPHIHHLDSEQRRWAHLASVFVNNFGNAVNAIAQEMMRAHGLDYDMLLPLIRETSLRADGPDLWERQTGPARRRDKATIGSHLDMLSDMPQLKELYEMMTKIIMSK